LIRAAESGDNRAEGEDGVNCWILFSVSGLGLALALGGCQLPGKEDLFRHSVIERMALAGDYQRIAQCAIDRFDNEPWSLGELPTPVSRINHQTNKQMIELAATYNSATALSAYAWIVTVTQDGPNKVGVEIVARNEMGFAFMSSRYFVDKVKTNFAACG